MKEFKIVEEIDGEVYEGGGDNYIIKSEGKLTMPCELVNKYLMEFDKKKVKLILTIQIISA